MPPKKGHSEADGMGGNHQSQGKGVLGGETLKTLPGCSEEATWKTRPSGTPRPSEKDQAGGAIGSTGEEFGGSHDHYIGHGAPQKTKVSTVVTDHGQGC